MLVFVIPLKSSQMSNSWERVCRLFERTVKSVCNQTVSQFRVIVVCHEKPNINFSHPSINYLKVDFPHPKAPTYEYKNTDKGRKILSGLIAATQFNPSHTMVVDADDCVSRKLAEFVQKNPQSNGWFIRQGYKYKENRHHPFIYFKRNNFYRMCGTCNILRYDLNFLPQNPEYNRGYGYYQYYIDHAKVKGILANQEIYLKPLPYPGAIYVLGHGDNNTDNENKLSFNWFDRKAINTSIREEFGFYTFDQLPQKERVLSKN